MGLFDGDPSAADLAQRFGLPVMAVMDSGSMAGTFGALAYGLQTFRPGLRWAGVLANRVASERHAAMLQAAVPQAGAGGWLGAVMRSPALTLPERHLGLVAAHELADSAQRLDAAADALAVTPLGQMGLQDLQRWAVDFPAPDDIRPVPPLLAGRTVALDATATSGDLWLACTWLVQQRRLPGSPRPPQVRVQRIAPALPQGIGRRKPTGQGRRSARRTAGRRRATGLRSGRHTVLDPGSDQGLARL